jgi:hypothetical protein
MNQLPKKMLIDSLKILDLCQLMKDLNMAILKWLDLLVQSYSNFVPPIMWCWLVRNVDNPKQLMLVTMSDMLLLHYTKMHLNLFWVSLNFEWIWAFLPLWNLSTPSWTRTNCYKQWVGSQVLNETRLFSSEIQIYQAIHLLVN